MTRARCLLVSGLVWFSGVACGSPPAEPAVPEASAPPPPAAAPAPPPEPAPAPTPTEAPPPEPEPEADATQAPAAEPGSRDVRYIVSPEGLKVKAEGVLFIPTVEVARVGGGWGVKVKVEARSDDEGVHSLLAPTDRELAFAGAVKRADGSSENFSDRREGERDLEVTPKRSVKLARAWPAKGGPKPLAPGDELKLQVGLWGLGADAASRRPLNKLCRVEVKFDKDKPRAKVMAPEGISK